MQDRYAGDAGDYGKFGLLRALVSAAAAQDFDFRLGILWYRYPDEWHTADGKHISYLNDSPRNDTLYRACDPELYAGMRRLVAGRRELASIPGMGILPASVVYGDEPLDFGGRTLPWQDRAEWRRAWAARALAAVESCNLVLMDPDNGLAGPRVSRSSRRAGKYVFLDEIEPMIARRQSVILYQHLDRSGPAHQQITRRAHMLQDFLGLREMPRSLRHSSGSGRVYYIMANQESQAVVDQAFAHLTAPPWSRHFCLVETS
jgi:hypothetical protein